MHTNDRTSELIRRHARSLDDGNVLDDLVAQIGAARWVLLGEATHGTREFYRLRIELTRKLIEEHGFDGVAVEADWPSALRASRYAQGAGSDRNADEALADFVRFPRWMWRNTEVAAWLDWLRAHNAGIADPARRIGFFGLDLYSLRESMEAVVSYLDREDPEAARRARARYACFDDLADDPQAYGQAVNFGMRDDCQRSVVQQLAELSAAVGSRLHADGGAPSDELFYAQQNARVVHNAEVYYRTMFGGRTDSWNVRDSHMDETLARLTEHLSAQRGHPARVVVWAHNSHLGDARATEVARQGQLNLGQLVRERCQHPHESFLVGFTTHTGTVTAASDWDAPPQRKHVRPSLPESIERRLHDSRAERFLLGLRHAPAELREALSTPRLERAIGVIYRPETERWSHYFEASLARQFDAVVHVDATEALPALDGREPALERGAPETYPSGV